MAQTEFRTNLYKIAVEIHLLAYFQEKIKCLKLVLLSKDKAFFKCHFIISLKTTPHTSKSSIFTPRLSSFSLCN